MNKAYWNGFVKAAMGQAPIQPAPQPIQQPTGSPMLPPLGAPNQMQQNFQQPTPQPIGDMAPALQMPAHQLPAAVPPVLPNFLKQGLDMTKQDYIQKHYEGFVKAAMTNGISPYEATELYKESGIMDMFKALIGRTANVQAGGPGLGQLLGSSQKGVNSITSPMQQAAGAAGAGAAGAGAAGAAGAGAASSGAAEVPSLFSRLAKQKVPIAAGAGGGLAGIGLGNLQGYGNGMEAGLNSVEPGINALASKAIPKAKAPSTPGAAGGMPDWAKYLLGAGAGGLGVGALGLMNQGDEEDEEANSPGQAQGAVSPAV